ncbi:MAG: tRNA (guanosine(37)-N1)-methyltransferase TrmD [Gammaproteobacteria bacterium]
MHFNVISIFPQFFDYLEYGILGKAKNSNLISVSAINPRNFSNFKNKKIDDNQFGDEHGMVMMAEPLRKSVKSIHHKRRGKIILMSPQGKILNHSRVKDLSKNRFLTIVCGRYEGIDQRFIDNYVDEEISIGNFVLTGGELPALLLIDAISRLIPGVVGRFSSVENDSFYNGLLKGPVYTRPRIFEGISVPDPLLSGNHQIIEDWRLRESLFTTYKKKPELFKEIKLTKKQKKLLEEIDSSIIL